MIYRDNFLHIVFFSYSTQSTYRILFSLLSPPIIFYPVCPPHSIHSTQFAYHILLPLCLYHSASTTLPLPALSLPALPLPLCLPQLYLYHSAFTSSASTTLPLPALPLPLCLYVTASWQYCHGIVAVGSSDSCAMGAHRIRHA
jgi:hypothetical protein